MYVYDGTYCCNCVNAILFPVLEVLVQLLFDFGSVELARAAEAEEERVGGDPWIAYSLGLDEVVLDFLQDLLLPLAQFAEVPCRLCTFCTL